MSKTQWGAYFQEIKNNLGTKFECFYANEVHT